MKHDWQELHPNVRKVCRFGWEPVRVCKLCGRAQRIEVETWWGRVSKRQWLPLVGRCPGVHDPNDLGKEVEEFNATSSN